MFVRAQRSGKRTYLLIVENEWAGGKVRQKVLHRLGRLDILQQTGKLDALMLSMQRFSDKFAVLGATENAQARTGQSRRIGPALIFERLWQQIGIEISVFLLNVRCFLRYFTDCFAQAVIVLGQNGKPTMLSGA